MDSKLFYSGTILLFNLFLVDSSMYLIDRNFSTLIHIQKENQPFTVTENRTAIGNILTNVDPKLIYEVPAEIMNSFFAKLTNGHKNQASTPNNFIFPGTKWCGPGNTAKSYNDLGFHSIEDSCCRNHDHCPSQLEPGQCRNGICNTTPYTRSHCTCDEEFRKCLLRANSKTANLIGTLYFNVARSACFSNRRSCPPSMRECGYEYQPLEPGNLSYSWFCEEWKFTPTEFYVPTLIERTNQSYSINEILDERRTKPKEPSKIDRELETIFGKEDDITRIMNDFQNFKN